MDEKILTRIPTTDDNDHQNQTEKKITEPYPIPELESEPESESECKSYFFEAKNTVGDNGKDAYPLPPWVKPDKIYQGQQFVKDHFFSVFFAHFISLIFLLCYGPVRLILLRTGKSDTKWKSLKRYFSTLIHIKRWYELEIIREDGEAAKDVKMVRQIHSKVAKCIWKTDQTKLKAKTLNTRKTKVTDNDNLHSPLNPNPKPNYDEIVEVTTSTTTTTCPMVFPSSINNNHNSHFHFNSNKPSHCCRSVDNSNGNRNNNNPHPKDVVNYVIVEEKGKGNYQNCDADAFAVKTNLSLSANLNLIRAVQQDFSNGTNVTIARVTQSQSQSSSSSTMNECNSNRNSNSDDNTNYSSNNNSYFPQLKRKEINENANGNYVITQLDMLVTQFCFMGFITMYPRQFGIMTKKTTLSSSSSQSKDKDNNAGLEGFIHLWALIGHLLGIDEKFNLCLDVNCHRIPTVLNNVLLSELVNCDLNTVTLWSSLIGGIASVIPFVSLKPILLFVRKLLVSKGQGQDQDQEVDHKNVNVKLNNFAVLSLFSIYDHLCYFLMDICFSSWLQYDGNRVFFNKLLRLAIFLSVLRLLPRKEWKCFGGSGSGPRSGEISVKTEKCMFSGAFTDIGNNNNNNNNCNQNAKVQHSVGCI